MGVGAGRLGAGGPAGMSGRRSGEPGAVGVRHAVAKWMLSAGWSFASGGATPGEAISGHFPSDSSSWAVRAKRLLSYVPLKRHSVPPSGQSPRSVRKRRVLPRGLFLTEKNTRAE